MATTNHTSIEAIRSNLEVRKLLREIGYVMWLSRQMAREIEAEKCQPIRPEMAEFCAIESTVFAV